MDILVVMLKDSNKEEEDGIYIHHITHRVPFPPFLHA